MIRDELTGEPVSLFRGGPILSTPCFQALSLGRHKVLSLGPCLRYSTLK